MPKTVQKSVTKYIANVLSIYSPKKEKEKIAYYTSWLEEQTKKKASSRIDTYKMCPPKVLDNKFSEKLTYTECPLCRAGHLLHEKICSITAVWPFLKAAVPQMTDNFILFSHH